MSDSRSQTKTSAKRGWMIFVIIIYLLVLLIIATYSLGAMGLGWLPVACEQYHISIDDERLERLKFEV